MINRNLKKKRLHPTQFNDYVFMLKATVMLCLLMYRNVNFLRDVIKTNRIEMGNKMRVDCHQDKIEVPDPLQCKGWFSLAHKHKHKHKKNEHIPFFLCLCYPYVTLVCIA